MYQERWLGLRRAWSAQGEAETAEESAEHHSRVDEDGGDKRIRGPASAEVVEFGNGFGEEQLERIALKIAKDGGAEDRGDNDDAEQAGADVIVSIRVGSVQVAPCLPLELPTGPKLSEATLKEGKCEPQREVYVGGYALDAKAHLESEKFPEHGWLLSSSRDGRDAGNRRPPGRRVRP